MNVTGLIIEYEEGGQDVRTTLSLFATLIRTGLAWKLQGAYGRTARALIDGGYISEDGHLNSATIEARLAQ